MPRSAKEFDVLPYEVREGMFIVDADGEHICHCPHPSLEVMQTVATVKAQLADESANNKSQALSYTLAYLSSGFVGMYELLYRIVNGRTNEERERAFEAADAYFRLGFSDGDPSAGDLVEGITLDCKRTFDLLAREGLAARSKPKGKKPRT